MSSETPHPQTSIDAPEHEYRAIRESAAVYDRSHVDALELTGDDRARFLNGQVTCDVAALSPGQAAYGFFTTAKGRIEADVTVICLEDRLWLEVPSGTGDKVLERLRKYIIFDQVTAEPLAARPTTLIGPSSAELLASLDTDGLTVVERHREKDGEQHSGGFDLWADDDLRNTVSRRLKDAGATKIGREAWERFRVESSRPRWGNDFGLDTFPQETGVEQAVSYTKGCYLGQEVVARIHYRGGVQRLLRGLRIHSEHGLAELIDAELQLDGKAVGRLGSITRSEEGWIGLSIVHNKATVGSTVALWSDGEPRGSAEVIELPFEPA